MIDCLKFGLKSQDIYVFSRQKKTNRKNKKKKNPTIIKTCILHERHRLMNMFSILFPLYLSSTVRLGLFKHPAYIYSQITFTSFSQPLSPLHSSTNNISSAPLHLSFYRTGRWFLRWYWFSPEVTFNGHAAKSLSISPEWSFTLELNQMSNSQAMIWSIAAPPMWI